MSIGPGAVAVPAAGWYPDPADPARLRWWSGAAWTEHLSGEVATADEAVRQVTRFARDPALRAVETEYAQAPRRDPYRDRNLLAGLALIVALLSIPGTVADAFLPLPMLVSYLISGAPISFAVIGLIASVKLGFSTRMAWAAVGISIVTMAAGWMLSAQQIGLDVPMPSVTDVPGVSEITELEGGLDG